MAIDPISKFELARLKSNKFQRRSFKLKSIALPIPIPFNFNRFRYQNIATTWQAISNQPDPNGQADKFRFLNFAGGENTGTELISGEWNTEWWGYEYRDIFNFSGTSYNIRGSNKPGNYKDENNVSLITPRHGICNEHWGNSEDPQVGDSMYFYDHTTGMSVSALVESVLNTNSLPLTGQDIRMVRYDRDLTALGDIKVYKLPLILNDLSANSFGVIYQAGNGAYGTGSSDRHAGLGTTGGRDAPSPYPTFLINIKIGKTDLWSVSSVFTNSYFSLSSLAVGDSSSPSFIITEDDILLLSKFWFANGTGPCFGLSAIHTLLRDGIETLGNPEGYNISTVRVT
tara:strand:- start:14032 stop:15057 length:1026 start_codon:yes stop_codon:yes gene_type:complete